MDTKHHFKFYMKKIYIGALSEFPTFIMSSAGVLIYVLGVLGFTLPYHFPDAGLMGIAILLKYTMGFSPSVVTLVANVGLLLWGGRQLSKRFVIWTVYNVFLMSFLLEFLKGVQMPHISDMFLVAVAGGLIKGIGLGLIFRTGASSGGLDVIIAVMRRRFGIEVGRYSFYCNMVILASSITTVGIEKVLFGIVASYTVGHTMDNVISSFDRRKLIFVIGSDTEGITHYIFENLNRGATILDSRGGYSKHETSTIMCLLTPRQTMELKLHIAKFHPRSFMVITDASEVLGKGFKKWKNA